jgi:hypothetical protein
MYKETAREWVNQMKAEGRLEGLDDEALDKLVNQYATKIEEGYEEAVKKQLEPVGKVAEFERMMIFDGQYMNKYLNQTIPGYPAFKLETMNQLKKRIMEK